MGREGQEPACLASAGCSAPAGGAGLCAMTPRSSDFSSERRMRSRINPANEMSGLVCVSLSAGQGDSVRGATGTLRQKVAGFFLEGDQAPCSTVL